jgi:hypothetical protein
MGTKRTRRSGIEGGSEGERAREERKRERVSTRARASEKGIERKTYRIDIDVGERGERGRTYIPPSCPNKVATISRRQL